MDLMNAQALLDDFEATESHALSENTIDAYQYRFNCYQKFISTFPGSDPDDLLSLRNIKIYLSYRKNNAKSYNTILADISAIRFYCEKNGFADITKSPEVKLFKKGLKRLLLAGKNPHAAEPIQKDQLIQIFHTIKQEDTKFFTTIIHIIIQYYGMLRISEVVSLRKEDLIPHYDDLNGDYFEIIIGKTKRDQEGVGRNIYIFSDKDFPDNVQYLKFYWETQKEGFLFPGIKPGNHISEVTVRKRFNKILIKAGIEPKSLSPHSLRKGAAQRLAQQSCPPEAIRYQGGWKSSVFLEYTKFDSEKTANSIKNKF